MALVYLYSHDGEGLGHFRRNLYIAEEACASLPDVSALLLTGSLYPGLFQLPARCDYIKIPSLQKSGREQYVSQLGNSLMGVSVKVRKDLLKSVIKSAPPDLLIVDKHAGGLNGELIPALKWLRHYSPNTRIVLGLRDILDTPEQVNREWRKSGTPEILRRYYDRAWIYGDPQIYDTLSEYSFAPELRRIGRSVGYVTRRPHPAPIEAETGYSVLVTAGGGHDGFTLLQASMHAIAQLRHKYGRITARLYTGPLMNDQEYRRLKEHARQYGGSMRVERFSQRLQRNIANADAVISMGGYNSILECISIGKPTIIVPREQPRKEQLIRAQAFEAAGFVRLVRQAELSGAQLSESLDSIFGGKWLPASANTLNFSGLDHIVPEIQQLLDTDEPREAYYAH
ncbi:MAG: glycosyltransferase family protein [Candidatus Sumerlaeaceae bacterium]